MEGDTVPNNVDEAADLARNDDTTKRGSYRADLPYWTRARSTTYSTIASSEGGEAAAITLKDNTEQDQSSHNQLWARAITIDDYVVIQGNNVGIGAYVVWICKVETLDNTRACCLLNSCPDFRSGITECESLNSSAFLVFQNNNWRKTRGRELLGRYDF